MYVSIRPKAKNRMNNMGKNILRDTVSINSWTAADRKITVALAAALFLGNTYSYMSL